jgi:hypothetical protein
MGPGAWHSVAGIQAGNDFILSIEVDKEAKNPFTHDFFVIITRHGQVQSL